MGTVTSYDQKSGKWVVKNNSGQVVGSGSNLREAGEVAQSYNLATNPVTAGQRAYISDEKGVRQVQEPGSVKATAYYGSPGAYPPPEEIHSSTYEAVDVTTGEKVAERRQIITNVAVSHVEARDAGLISQREYEAAEQEGGRTYYTSTEAIRNAGLLKEAYGDRVKVSPGYAPAQAYYDYHVEREDYLERTAERPETKILYTISQGALGFGTVFSAGEAIMVGDSYEKFYQGEKEKIKTWVEPVLDFDLRGTDVSHWALGSTAVSTVTLGASMAGFGVVGGTVGKVAQFGVAAVWAAGSGVQIGETIAKPSPRNVARTILWVAPAVAYAGARGIGKAVAYARARNAPVANSVVRSNILVNEDQTAGRGLAAVITRVGTGKTAKTVYSKVESRMAFKSTEQGVEETSGLHLITSRVGKRIQTAVVGTKDIGISGEGSGASYQESLIISRGGKSTRMSSGVQAAESIAKARSGNYDVETFKIAGTSKSGKRAIMASKVSQGENGPVIEAAAWLSKDVQENQFAGISKIFTRTGSRAGSGSGSGSRGISILSAEQKGSAASGLTGATESAKSLATSLGRAEIASAKQDLPFIFGTSSRTITSMDTMTIEAHSPVQIVSGPKMKNKSKNLTDQSFDILPRVEQIADTGTRTLNLRERTEERVVPTTLAEAFVFYETQRRAAVPKVTSMTIQPQYLTGRMRTQLTTENLTATRTKVSRSAAMTFTTLYPDATLPPGIPGASGLETKEVFGFGRPRKKKRTYYYEVENPIMSPADILGIGRRKK